MILFKRPKRSTVKRRIYIFAVVGLIAGTFLIDYGITTRQNTERAGQLMAAKANDAAEREKFKSDTDKQIKESRERIAAFKEKMRKTDHRTKASVKKRIMKRQEKKVLIAREVNTFPSN